MVYLWPNTVVTAVHHGLTSAECAEWFSKGIDNTDGTTPKPQRHVPIMAISPSPSQRLVQRPHHERKPQHVHIGLQPSISFPVFPLHNFAGKMSYLYPKPIGSTRTRVTVFDEPADDHDALDHRIQPSITRVKSATLKLGQPAPLTRCRSACIFEKRPSKAISSYWQPADPKIYKNISIGNGLFSARISGQHKPTTESSTLGPGSFDVDYSLVMPRTPTFSLPFNQADDIHDTSRTVKRHPNLPMHRSAARWLNCTITIVICETLHQIVLRSHYFNSFAHAVTIVSKLLRWIRQYRNKAKIAKLSFVQISRAKLLSSGIAKNQRTASFHRQRKRALMILIEFFEQSSMRSMFFRSMNTLIDAARTVQMWWRSVSRIRHARLNFIWYQLGPLVQQRKRRKQYLQGSKSHLPESIRCRLLEHILRSVQQNDIYKLSQLAFLEVLKRRRIGIALEMSSSGKLQRERWFRMDVLHQQAAWKSKYLGILRAIKPNKNKSRRFKGRTVKLGKPKTHNGNRQR